MSKYRSRMSQKMKICGISSLSQKAQTWFIVFLLIIVSCSGAQLSERESFLNFITALDPQNVLRINWNGRIPHPCSDYWKGVKCMDTTITEIRLESKNLRGTIDADSLCQLPNLRVLSLSKNHVHGDIPFSLLHCQKLTYLNLSSNQLSGRVPVVLIALKQLRTLDISNNHFGIVPDSEHKFSLPQTAGKTYKLRKLVKAVDESSGSTKTNFVEHYSEPQSGSDPGSGKKQWYEKPIFAVGLAIVIVICIVFIYFGIKKVTDLDKEKETLKSLAQTPQRPPPVAPEPREEEEKPKEKSSELVFFVEEKERFGLNDLLETTAELQRQTTCSSLYKVTLKNNFVYAVKRLKKLQISLEEFGQTMKQLGRLRHPNILPLVGYNSTCDEKLLIYRYQSNGSLLNLLDDYVEGKREFPWKLRLSIATGIARGLDFIHQNSVNGKIIPHGNLKLSNILLDENNEPLISEYGISWFLDSQKVCIFSSSGYSAPEKTLSERSDVFSFGIILLELLTGKTVEKSGIDLPKWVKSMVREEWTGEVFDKEVNKAAKQYAFPLLNVALKCVSKTPEDRPTMVEVMEKMDDVINSNDDHDITMSSMASIESGSQDWSILHSVIPETWDTPGSNY